MIQLENFNGDTNYNLLEDDDIVNSLTNSATNKALSANQGKQLKTIIDSVLPDIEKDTEIPLNFNLFGSKAYLKLIHTGALSALTSPSISNGVSNIKDVLQVPWLSWAYSNTGVWVSLPRPTRGQAEANQGVMVNVSRTNISITTGSDANFDDSYVAILYNKN